MSVPTTTPELRARRASLYDSHCHLDFDAFEGDRDEVWARALEAGVTRAFVPGYDVAQWRRLPDLRSRYLGLSVGVGLHPFALQTNSEATSPAPDLEQLLADAVERVGAVAIGECGLHGPHKETFAFQEQVLRVHLRLAHDLGLPLVLHAVHAHARMLELLREVFASSKLSTSAAASRARGAPFRGVVHAYSGSLELAGEYLKLGFSVAFGGAITRPGHRRARAAAATLPLEALLLESDAPSAPLQGGPQRNEPASVRVVATALAALRGISEEEVARVTSDNAEALFGR